jgi:DNA gyrase/topoisomerase IV subunit B
MRMNVNVEKIANAENEHEAASIGEPRYAGPVCKRRTMYMGNTGGGKEHARAYSGGERIEPRQIGGAISDRTGTRITFTPSLEIFTSTEFDYKVLCHELHDLAALCPGVRFIIDDLRKAPPRRDETAWERGKGQTI